MNLRLVRVRENVPAPTFATDGATGLDFYIPEEFFEKDADGTTRFGHFNAKRGALPLGWKIAIPPGYGQIADAIECGEHIAAAGGN